MLNHFGHAYLTFMISCVGAPLQIEGQIAEYSFYYRERHGKWGLEVGKSSDVYNEAVRTFLGPSTKDHEEVISVAIQRIVDIVLCKMIAGKE